MNSENLQPNAEQPDVAELSNCEQIVAKELFKQVFPELVRLHFNRDLKKATTEAVAALKAGLVALREHEGRCACLEGKTRWGMSIDLFAPTDSSGLCKKCGQIRQGQRSARPNDPGTHS